MAGWAPEQWLGLWQLCHRATPVGFAQWCWPDGGSALAQDAVVVDVFRVISGAFADALREQSRGKR